MDDEIDLPPGIGPHNDRELELMLAGTKPQAIFPSDAVQRPPPKAEFTRHLAFR
ncbi:hypothetical protein [Thalassospira tepidiphila]|uniref:hypothetical protein n=1 Tax=Thalassospira tepidiphila TaxID=393657 RepID=UPI00292511FC|nr:hypothetical protein MACH01_09910 [Thalassospira tepidiphila]